jgi:hypothetical protein
MFRNAMVFALVPLIGAGPTAAQLTHRFSAGENLHYRYSYDFNVLGHRQSMNGEFRMTIGSADPEIAGTEIRTQVTPAMRATRSFTIAKDGSLRFSGDKSPSHNYAVYDPHSYCPLPALVAVGDSWSCQTESLGYFHGGETHVRVVSADEFGVTLQSDGSGVDPPHDQRVPENGRVYTTRASATWHETVRFKDGLVTSIARDQILRAVTENLTLETRQRTRIERI